MKVTLIRAKITALAPFGIGGTRSGDNTDISLKTINPEVDVPVLRDGFGRPFVPGTSIAGSLRAHLDTFGLAEEWMGSEAPDGEDAKQAPEQGDGGTKTVPSKIRVLGTVLTTPEQPFVQRKQTAIEPERAAARSKSLRHSEFVAANSQVDVFLSIHDGDADWGENAGDSTLADLLEVLAQWEPRLGGKQTAGYGNAQLTELFAGELDLSNPEDLTTWLSYGGPELHHRVATNEVKLETPEPITVVAQSFKIVDGLAVGGDGQEVREADDKGSVRTVLRDPDGVAVIEGTSLKGVLRSRAGFILRSLGHEACTDHVGCGKCGVGALFGHGSQRGQVVVHRARIKNPKYQVARHVGIDRFTGGALDRVLFDVEVVSSGTFLLWVDAFDYLAPWAENLIRWVVRDIADGFVGIGGLTARGHGTVAIQGDDTIGRPEPIEVAEVEEFVTAAYGEDGDTVLDEELALEEAGVV